MAAKRIIEGRTQTWHRPKMVLVLSGPSRVHPEDGQNRFVKITCHPLQLWALSTFPFFLFFLGDENLGTRNQASFFEWADKDMKSILPFFLLEIVLSPFQPRAVVKIHFAQRKKKKEKSSRGEDSDRVFVCVKLILWFSLFQRGPHYAPPLLEAKRVFLFTGFAASNHDTIKVLKRGSSIERKKGKERQ